MDAPTEGSTPAATTPRAPSPSPRRGRPANDAREPIRLRNLRWYWEHRIMRESAEAIARAADVDPRTVRSGIKAAEQAGADLPLLTPRA